MGDKFVVYEEKQETAVLIAVCTQQQNREKTEEYLDELAFLVETAGGVPVARFIQPPLRIQRDGSQSPPHPPRVAY